MRALQLLSGGIFAILWHRLTLINDGSVKLPSKILDAYSIAFAKLVFLAFVLIFFSLVCLSGDFCCGDFAIRS